MPAGGLRLFFGTFATIFLNINGYITSPFSTLDSRLKSERPSVGKFANRWSFLHEGVKGMANFDIGSVANEYVEPIVTNALQTEAHDYGMTDNEMRLFAFNDDIREQSELVVDEIVSDWSGYDASMYAQDRDGAMEYLSENWSDGTVSDYVLDEIDYEKYRDMAVEELVLYWENIPMTADIDSGVLTQSAQSASLQDLFAGADNQSAAEEMAEKLIPEDFWS